jgi:hypothetical protein
MARGDGFDFTPILTHYVFLVTFVLAIVSGVFIFCCAVAPPPPPVELTQFSQSNRRDGLLRSSVKSPLKPFPRPVRPFLPLSPRDFAHHLTQIPPWRVLFGSVFCTHVHMWMPLPYSLTTLLCVSSLHAAVIGGVAWTLATDSIALNRLQVCISTSTPVDRWLPSCMSRFCPLRDHPIPRFLSNSVQRFCWPATPTATDLHLPDLAAVHPHVASERPRSARL